MTRQNKFDRMLEELQRVNVSLENLRITLATAVATNDDHETRLRTVEQWKGSVSPLLAFIAFVSGALLTHVIAKLPF